MCLLLGLTVLIASCDRQSAPAPQPVENKSPPTSASPPAALRTGVDRSHKGKPWPAISFEAPNGDKVTLQNFAGRPVLVNLWATWCTPCIKELPSIETLARSEAERLQVLAISQDDKGGKVVDPWWQSQGFTLLQPYLDTAMAFSFKLGGDGVLPVTVLYSASGKEIWRVTGPMEWDGAEAKALLAEAFS